MNLVRIGTRTSPLALAQAHYVADLLRRHDPECEVEIVGIKTRGDLDQDPNLWRRRDTGGIGFFVAEVERALLDGRCDIAVHSLKDMPTGGTPGLTVAAVPPREDPLDVLVLPPSNAAPPSDPSSVATAAEVFQSLPPGSRIGTASARRERQILHLRPDLQVLPVRGNVDTRLRKLDAGEYDAIILAAAGLARLGIRRSGMYRLPPELMVPAPGQGALGVQCRSDDELLVERLRRISDPITELSVACERAFLAAVEGGCRLPIGAYLRPAPGAAPAASSPPASSAAPEAAADDLYRFELMVFAGPEEAGIRGIPDRNERFEAVLRTVDEARAFGAAVGRELRGGIIP